MDSGINRPRSGARPRLIASAEETVKGVFWVSRVLKYFMVLSAEAAPLLEIFYGKAAGIIKKQFVNYTRGDSLHVQMIR